MDTVETCIHAQQLMSGPCTSTNYILTTLNARQDVSTLRFPTMSFTPYHRSQADFVFLTFNDIDLSVQNATTVVREHGNPSHICLLYKQTTTWVYLSLSLSRARSLKPYKNQYLIPSSSSSLDRNNNYPQELPPIHATIAHKEEISERTREQPRRVPHERPAKRSLWSCCSFSTPFDRETRRQKRIVYFCSFF